MPCDLLLIEYVAME